MDPVSSTMSIKDHMPKLQYFLAYRHDVQCIPYHFSQRKCNDSTPILVNGNTILVTSMCLSIPVPVLDASGCDLKLLQDSMIL